MRIVQAILVVGALSIVACGDDAPPTKSNTAPENAAGTAAANRMDGEGQRGAAGTPGAAAGSGAAATGGNGARTGTGSGGSRGSQQTEPSNAGLAGGGAPNPTPPTPTPSP